MQLNRGAHISICVFSIAILFVFLGFFLAGIERIALHFFSWGSLLISLVISMLATILLVSPQQGRSHLFYTAALGSAIGVYEAAIVVSVLFTRAFVGNLGGFVILGLLIHALFFIAAILIIAATDAVQWGDAKTRQKIQNGDCNDPKRGGF